MTKFITTTVLLVAFTSLACGQSLFVGPLRRKGTWGDHAFEGISFAVEYKQGSFNIRKVHGVKSFTLKSSEQSIRDLVISVDGSAVAVAFDSVEWRKSEMALATISDSGKRRFYRYQSGNLTQNFEWLVELGAVSKDGVWVLAKCAFLGPEEDGGLRSVRHQWVILQLGEDSVTVRESKNAIDKWSHYASGA